MYNVFKFLIVLLLLNYSVTFSQESKSQFSHAEQLFKKAYTVGDYSNWSNADSIFLELNSREGFLDVKEQILSRLYRTYIFIYYNPINEEQLQNIIEAINLFDLHQLSDNYLLQELLYVKELLKLRLGKPNAETNLLRQIEEFSNTNTPNLRAIGGMHDALCRYYYSKGNFKAALPHAQNYLRLIQETPYNELYIAALQSVGAVHYNLDQIEECIYYMKSAYALIKKNPKPDYQRLSQLASNIAILFQGKTGDLVEAEFFFKEAIDAEIKAVGEESAMLITYYSLLADNYYFLKDLEQAFSYAQKGYVLANEILKTESVYLKSLPSMSLSRVYAKNGDFQKARATIDAVVTESIDFFGKHDKFTAQAYIDKANVEVRAKNYNEAEKYFLLAVEASEAIDRVYSMLSAYTSLTKMYLEIESYEKALHFATLSYDLQKQNMHPEAKVVAKDALLLVNAYIGLGKTSEAKKYLDEIKKIIHSNENAELLEIEALSLENELLYTSYKMGDQEALSIAYENIEPLMEGIVNGRALYNYQDSKLFYSQTVAPYIETALKIAKTKFENDENSTALQTLFQLMEMNKSSILLDGIIDMKVRAEKGIPENIAIAENKLRRDLSNVQKELFQEREDSLASVERRYLIDQQLVLNNKIDSINNHLKENYPEWHKARNIINSKSLSHYQQNVLKKNQIVIEYYATKSSLFRMLISQEAVVFKEIDDIVPINQKIDTLIKGILEIKNVDEKAKSLAKDILPEIPNGISEIIIVADGKLTQIPFEILLLDGKLLVENYYISYAGSFQLYEEQVAIGNRKGENKWVGFAPDYLNVALPNNKGEVLQISSLTNGLALLGEKATKASFIDNSHQASILHLATHANLDQENPMRNKMLFYEQENEPYELTAAEIYNLNLNASLAVLSACNTGIGKTDSGDGVLSMARAFTYAGVSSTIMSLWQVPDQETAEIMVSFYEHLKKGKKKNEALAMAKRDFIENNPLKSHPYFWAGFVVNGDVSPVFETNLNIILLLIFMVILILWTMRIVSKRQNKKN